MTAAARTARYRATGSPASAVLREPAAVAAWGRLRRLARATGVPVAVLLGRVLVAGLASLFGPDSDAPGGSHGH